MIISNILFFIILPILFIGFLGYIFDKVSKNPMAQTLFEKETLKAMDSKDGKNHIREQAQLANKDTFDRAFKKIEEIEKVQDCHSVDIRKINETLISFMATITTDIKYLVKTVDEIKNKKTSK